MDDRLLDEAEGLSQSITIWFNQTDDTGYMNTGDALNLLRVSQYVIDALVDEVVKLNELLSPSR